MSRSAALLAGLAGLAIAGVIVLAAMGRPIPDLLTYVATTTVGGAAGAAAPGGREPTTKPARARSSSSAGVVQSEQPAAAAEGPPWHGKQRMRGPQ